jgi:hypothetical protein
MVSSDLSNPAVFTTIVVSVIVVDLIVLFLIRFYPDFWGKDINVWYNEFGLNAVIADVMSIVLGFLITQVLYRATVFPYIGWSLPAFIAVLLAVQLTHDMLFYKGVIQPIPVGHNGMIDVFKAYAASGQGRILIADAAMMVGSALIASTLVSLPTVVTLFVGSLAVYAVPYILTTRNRYTNPAK